MTESKSASLVGWFTVYIASVQYQPRVSLPRSRLEMRPKTPRGNEKRTRLYYRRQWIMLVSLYTRFSLISSPSCCSYYPSLSCSLRFTKKRCCKVRKAAGCKREKYKTFLAHHTLRVLWTRCINAVDKFTCVSEKLLSLYRRFRPLGMINFITWNWWEFGNETESLNCK